MKKCDEYWVEYNFNEDGRPNNIRVFKEEADANEFAKDIPGAHVVGLFRCAN